MADNVEIQIDLLKGKDETSKVTKSLADLDKGASRAQKGLAKVTDFLGSPAFIAGAAAAAVAVAGFGAQLIEIAAAANEAQSKFDTVFSNFGDQVTAELDEFAEAAGRSKFELRGYASALGDTLQPMGFAEERTAGLTTSLVKLATDLSSFNDMPMDEALQRLQGTLIGSHENALAFGVVINDNVLKAELAANGWDKLTGAQLEQAKVQARINLLMEGTTAAQGDAIKTADGWTNTMRALQATLKDVATEMGQELIPVLKPLLINFAEFAKTAGPGAVKVLKDLVPLLEATVEHAGKLAEGVGQTADAFNDGIAFIDDFSGAFNILSGGILSGVTEGLDMLQDEAEDLNETLDKSSQPARTYTTDIIAAAEAQLEAERSSIAYQTALADQIAAQEAATAKVRGYFDEAVKAESATINTNQAIYDSAAAAGASAEELALLGTALGVLTEEQATAALKTALLKQKIDELTASWDGSLEGIRDMKSELGEFARSLEELPSEKNVQLNATRNITDVQRGGFSQGGLVDGSSGGSSTTITTNNAGSNVTVNNYGQADGLENAIAGGI